MKKCISVIVLLLVGVSIVYAEWEFWGEFRTGLRIETIGGGEDWYGTNYVWRPVDDRAPEGDWHWAADGRRPFDPSISIFNYFMGNYIAASARWTRGVYGFKATLWFNIFRHRTFIDGTGREVSIYSPFDLWSAYMWLDVLDNQVRLTFGRMGCTRVDQVWVAPGTWDADHNFSLGDGLRIEIMPWMIEGLNFGVSLFVPNIHDDFFHGRLFWTSGEPDIITGQLRNFYRLTTNPSGWRNDSINAKFRDFLLNTGFGMELDRDPFRVAAGFRLGNQALGLTDTEWSLEETYFEFGLWQLFGWPAGVLDTAHLLADFPFTEFNIFTEEHLRLGTANTLNLMSGGMSAYMGVHLRMFDPFHFQAGVRLYNLGAWREFGWMWLNQELSYSWGNHTLRLEAHQRIFTMDNNLRTFARVWVNDQSRLPEDLQEGMKPILFRFVPHWSAMLTTNWFAVFETPVKFWPGIVDFDVRINPRVGYTVEGVIFGRTLIVELSYILSLIQFSDRSHFFSDAGLGNAAQAPFRRPDLLIRNIIQLNFSVAF